MGGKAVVGTVLICIVGLANNVWSQIRLNQIGFYPEGKKIAVVRGATAEKYEVIRDSDATVVHTGQLHASAHWNASQQDLDNCDYYPSTLPALSYVDENCSYASNEVAINWNAQPCIASTATGNP